MPFDWPKQNTHDLNAFYGNPDVNGDGQADPAWEAANLVYIVPPFPMFWSWGGVCKKIRVHKKCADSLMRILTEIGKIPENNRSFYQLNQCGGAYNFRPMRGAATLSMHARGCAIDLAPLANPLGKPWSPHSPMMPIEVVRIFEAEGWTWGGEWHRPDPQHFQAAFV